MDASAVDIWKDDLLERKADAEFLEKFLVNRMEERKTAGLSGSYVLNIDAGWGYGKSFFMRRFKKQLERSGHPVVMIDAWKNDFSDDPYTNVIAEIEGYFQTYLDKQKTDQPAPVKAYDAVKRHAAKIAWIALKGAAKKASRYVFDDAGDQIKEVIDQHVVVTGDVGQGIADAAEAQFVEVTDGIIDAFAKKRLDEFNEAKVSLDLFRDSLGKLLTAFEEHAGKKLPFFILIDELDRCRPTYAISMLERIKHLFDADNVVFILSADTEQLAHSISAIYGSTFDSRRYLQRFFMRTYELPTPSRSELIESLIQDYKPDLSKWANPGMEQDAPKFLSNAATNYNFNLRETKQAIDILASLTTVWIHDFPIQLGVMFPLILGHLRREDIGQLEQENSWFQRLVGKATKWDVDNQWHDHRGRRKQERNSVAQLVKSLVARAQAPLQKALNDAHNEMMGDASFPTVQAYGVFNTELSARRKNRDTSNDYSLILSYPDLIRHAGRLSS